MTAVGPWVRWAALVVAAVGGWWFGDRAPYPYAQRWILDLPLPGLGNDRLDQVLQPQPGERILEIGPGTGRQALHMAAQLEPGGRLDIVDVQQQMLDHVLRRAADRKLGNIVATCADAQQLPFPDHCFDAAYLITTLGEIPRPGRTLRELHRVLRTGGRLVVGEFFDRHQVRYTTLRIATEACGFTGESRWNWGPVAYLASFRSPVQI